MLKMSVVSPLADLLRKISKAGGFGNMMMFHHLQQQEHQQQQPNTAGTSPIDPSKKKDAATVPLGGGGISIINDEIEDLLSCDFAPWAQPNFSRVQYLIRQGGKVNLIGKNGRTLLLVASQYGNVECVDFLLEHGATVDLPQRDGWTPLYVSCERGHLNVAQLLITKGGASIDQASQFGWTPLYIASQNGHLHIVQYLTEKGTSMNQAQRDGWTPLHIACQKGHVQVVKYLIEKGADDNIKCHFGDTPLDKAKRKKHGEIIQFLTDHQEQQRLAALSLPSTSEDDNEDEDLGSCPVFNGKKILSLDEIKIILRHLGDNMNSFTFSDENDAREANLQHHGGEMDNDNNSKASVEPSSNMALCIERIQDICSQYDVLEKLAREGSLLSLEEMKNKLEALEQTKKSIKERNDAEFAKLVKERNFDRMKVLGKQMEEYKQEVQEEITSLSSNYLEARLAYEERKAALGNNQDG